MGLLVDGQWQDRWYDTDARGGRFEREAAGYRNWITRDGEAGPSGVGGFRARPGRYHLYVAWPCPWSHRVILYRMLFGLQAVIGLSAVDPLMLERGWTFSRSGPDRRDPLIRRRLSVPALQPRRSSLHRSRDRTHTVGL